ncbi:MAG: glycosyltransferase family 39 protein [Steroidobacteraceae bacterium]
MAYAVAPLADVLVFCALIAAGTSLRSSSISAFAVGVAFNWLLTLRAGAKATKRPWRAHLELLLVALLAVFLRGGALGLLTQTWDLPPQLAILFAVALGLAVTVPGYSYALSAAPNRPASQTLAIGIIVYSVVLRLLYAGSVELMPEETYYWNYSQHLDIGYLDHPPMVAWLIRLGTMLFGQTEFGVRAGAICCGAIASWFVYRLARNLFDEAGALAALVLAQTLPFFFLSGFLMTPDAPLTAAWAASLYYLERALIAERPDAWWRAGICLGLGLISKYSIALLGPVALAFMLWDPQSRRWLRRFEPYIAALLALGVFSPVIIWNAQHDWASFAFQTSRRLAEAPQFALHKLIASALVLITPTGVVAVAAALLRGSGGVVGDPQSTRRRLFMNLAILIPLSVFVAFSLRHEVKLDWTGAMWSAALPALGCSMIAAGFNLRGLGAWIRSAWAPTIVTMLLIYSAGLHYLVLGLPGVGYGKHIELVPVGWRVITREVLNAAADHRKETGSDALIVGMDRYAIASEVAFYGRRQLRSPIETMNSYLFDGMSLMYGRWTPPESQQHRDLLLVAFSAAELQGQQIESHVKRLGPIEDMLLMQDDSVIRHYYYRLAYDYEVSRANAQMP